MRGSSSASHEPKYQPLPEHPPLPPPPPSASKTTTKILPEKHVQGGKVTRCPKLSRYKLVGVGFVMTFAVVLIGFARIQTRQPTLATCLQTHHVDAEAFKQDRQFSAINHLRYSHTKRQLPHCLIIGARKAGTRALLYFLNLHSQIQTAGREIHFFDSSYEQGIEWYRKQMPFSFKDQITIEKSPAYFVDPDVPERVFRMNSSIKLLLIVRDPIDRTVSDYLQIMDNKATRHKAIIPFEKLVLDQETFEINKSYTAIKRSIYIRHLQRWLQFFPLQQIHIVDGDHLINRPWEEIAKVEDLLGLEHQITQDKFTFNRTRGFYCYRANNANQCLAKGKGRSHPSIDPYVLQKLVEFFEPYNEKFFIRIGRRFEWRHWQ